MKNHALRRIAFISILLIIFTDIVLTFVLFFYSSSIVTESCTQKARDFQKSFYDLSAKENVRYLDIDNVGEDTLDFKFVMDYLRGMFAFSEAKYTYMFHASHEEENIKYIFVIAADEEVDKQLAGDRRKGVVVKPGNHSFIDRALDGELAGPERVNNQFGDVLMYYFPVYDDDGNVGAVAGIDFDVTVNRHKTKIYVIQLLSIVTIVLVTVLGLLLLVLRRKVFKPIKSISMQMNTFDPEKEHKRLKLDSYLEIEEINSSFDKMSEDIIGYIKNLRSMTEERSRAAAELSIARSIQIGMVPHKLDISGACYDIHAYASPAKEVGGDFYDCFEMDGNVFIVIADVSGKGIAAAMFMAMVKNMIKAKLRAGLSPADALNSANDEICAENPEGMFVTVFAAVFDPVTGEFLYANAGHTRPLVVCGEEKYYLDPDPGIVLGLFEDSGIMNGSVILKDGSTLTVYTDGITEALNGSSELFGEQRLLEAIQPGSALQTALSVINSVRNYSAGCEQSDDITIVTARFKACEGYSDTVLSPEMDSLDAMRSVVLTLTGSNSTGRSIALACEEILVNIINYSGTDNIRLTVGKTAGVLVVRMEDNGKAFDPLSEMPAEKDFDDYDKGGLGIRMVTQIAEKTVYSRIGDRNIICMRFSADTE